MENEEGKNVDLYIPRKCSYTNRLITAKDHASIQLNVAHVDATGAAIPGEYTPFVISGFVRNKGESDAAINLLAQKNGLLKGVIETHAQ